MRAPILPAKDLLPDPPGPPGWVRTDMGGPAANLSPEESARALLAIIKGLGNSDNGKFYRYDGVELEW